MSYGALQRPRSSHDEEAAHAYGLIEHVVEVCPNRLPASAAERSAQQIFARELEAAGASVTWQGFRYSKNLYAVLLLHFGLASVASVVALWAPWIAGLLHLLVGVSYLGDSARRFILLRRLLPYGKSQNLLALLHSTVPEPRLRVVLIAHADAAYTGLMFHPNMIKYGTRAVPVPGLGWLRKGLRVATCACFLLAAVDVGLLLFGAHPALLWLLGVLSFPGLVVTLLNAEVVLRNQVVDGANDNLTGCAALVLLAQRLRRCKPDDVEIVLAISGAEEAGTGGAWALASTHNRGTWSRRNTVVVGLDGLTNGELRLLRDGEVVPVPVATWLLDVVQQVAALDPRFATIRPFDIPSGATDLMPFLAQGYHGICLGCVDPDIGAPLHYHRVTDTPANLDMEQFMHSLDFVEAFVCGLSQVEDERRL